MYGEDMPYPLGEGYPIEGIQRPVGSIATVPSIVDTSQVGVVFQREIYDDLHTTHTSQVLVVPGVADRTERRMAHNIEVEL